MGREDIEKLTQKRPFRPFVVELADGRRFRFGSVEEFSIGRTTLETLDRAGNAVLISLILIATITVEKRGEGLPAGGAA